MPERRLISTPWPIVKLLEWAEDTATPIPMEAQIVDGVLTGTFYEAAIGVTASRG